MDIEIQSCDQQAVEAEVPEIIRRAFEDHGFFVDEITVVPR